MTSQFMVRILRDTDEDYADVVVDADDAASAKETALNLVRTNPDRWFGHPTQPKYLVDPSGYVEELDGTEYASANR